MKKKIKPFIIGSGNIASEYISVIKSYEDIVGAVLFLCSDMSNYITGQNFIVDGGWGT